MPRFAIAMTAFLLAILATSVTQPGYAADWVTVTGDGKFTVQMPGAPEEETDMVDSGIGRMPVHIYQSAIADQISFTVIFVDFDKTMLSRTTPEKFLQSGQRGAARKTNTTIRSSQPIQLGRWPGIGFVADNAQIIYTSNAYLVDNRLYQLVVVTNKDVTNAQAAAKFFGSFDVADK